MAKKLRKQPAVTPAKAFQQLIPAVQFLDSWLVWMEDACGESEGRGGTRNLPYLHRPPVLSSIGGSLGEDGDDGALSGTCRLLCEVVEPLNQQVQTWAPQLTGGAERVFSDRLFSFAPQTADLCGSWTASVCLSVAALPTAHEATSTWLKRFCDLAVETVPSFRTTQDQAPWEQEREMCPAFFRGLTWNSEYAAELLAGMEQERRWLHNQFGKIFEPDGSPADEFQSLWHPLEGPWESIEKIVETLSLMPCEVLQALRRSSPQTKHSLRANVLGPRTAASGQFNAALNLLKDRQLVISG